MALINCDAGETQSDAAIDETNNIASTLASAKDSTIAAVRQLEDNSKQPKISVSLNG